MRHAKIVCTLGPATAGYDNVRRLIESGMDVARLNFSHGDHQIHRQAYVDVRRAALEVGRAVAVLADLSGPKIRLGDIAGGKVEVEPGAVITFCNESTVGTADRIGVNYPDLAHEVTPDMALFVDDGLLEFRVLKVDGDDVVCRAVTGGTLQSRKGLNVPRGGLAMPALTDKDRADLDFGRSLGVDYFALSFVRRPSDVTEAKGLAGSIPIIAKIEKPQAIDCLDELADVADGFMVARGDLGVETGAEKVPLLQKRMIRLMNRRAKPVITATQMLESMVTNPRPTRAEVSDVANAILDGSDAVMLSAESAAGKYPFLAVETMGRIITEVETTARAANMLTPPAMVEASGLDHAIAHAAARAAVDLDLAAIVVYSETGRSAALASAYRPPAMILGFSSRPETLNRMALYWGVVPVTIDRPRDFETVARQVEAKLLATGLAKPGSHVAITFALEHGPTDSANTLRLWTLGDGGAGGNTCLV